MSGGSNGNRISEWKWTGLGVAVLFGAAAASGSSRAEAKPPLGKNWPASQLLSIDEINHSTLDGLLKRHVDPDGYVDYKAWQRSSSDRRSLQNYLRHLSRADVRKRSSKKARLAFWINAYNAVTIEGILQEYPTSSIRKHTARLVGYNIWKELPLLVGGTPYSLEQMEHQVLRKMSEPRIHFAIVCASVGCPRLRNEAYVAERVNDQLADNARDFFSRKGNFQYDTRSRTLRVSSILDWFGDDFGGTQVKRFTYLKPYLPTGAQRLAVDSRTRVTYLDYDWSLNDQARRRTASNRR